MEKQLKELTPGTIFTKGTMKFVVIEQQKSTTIVILNDIIDNMKFDQVTSDWSKSNLRKYLNNDILKDYEALFGDRNIVETKTDLTTLDGLDKFGTCKDKVRLLTFEERRKYHKLYEHSGNEEWTVTSWSTFERGWKYQICCISEDGDIFSDDCFNDNIYVRPVCILKSNIYVSVDELSMSIEAKKFIVSIEETISQDFEIEASCSEEAAQIAATKYWKGEISINSENVTFRQINVNSEHGDTLLPWEELK